MFLKIFWISIKHLFRLFNRKVDLVNMIYVNKFIKDSKIYCNTFLDNVYSEAISVNGNNDKYIIRMSILMGKT